jgi:hypothetical protein
MSDNRIEPEEAKITMQGYNMDGREHLAPVSVAIADLSFEG